MPTIKYDPSRADEKINQDQHSKSNWNYSSCQCRQLGWSPAVQNPGYQVAYRGYLRLRRLTRNPSRSNCLRASQTRLAGWPNELLDEPSAMGKIGDALSLELVQETPLARVLDLRWEEVLVSKGALARVDRPVAIVGARGRLCRRSAGGRLRRLRRQPAHCDFPAVDMHALPFHGKAFDLIIHSDTLEHVERPVRALEECRRRTTESRPPAKRVRSLGDAVRTRSGRISRFRLLYRPGRGRAASAPAWSRSLGRGGFAG